MKFAYFTGFADEAGAAIDTQIRATRELGWSDIEMRNVEMPGFPGGNLHDIPAAAFERVTARLDEAGMRVNSLGSCIANGAKDIREPFVACLEAARRAAPRAQRLGAEFIRVMSYPVGNDAELMEEERFQRMREIVAVFEGSGVRVVHENCGNYGGMGWTYSLRLLENVPGLRLVFDMGNCVQDADYTQPAPRPRQDPWVFFEKVRPYIDYIHIKDAVFDSISGHARHVFPGEGSGRVRDILANLLQTGYAGGLSIEPHMGAGLDAPDLSDDQNRFETYVAYGRKLMELVDGLSPKKDTTRPLISSEVK